MKAKIAVGKISRVCSLMFRFLQQRRAESPMLALSPGQRPGYTMRNDGALKGQKH